MTATTSAATPVLEVRELVKRFGTAYAVDHASLTIQPGEVFTLLGPSGCGKTTMLRMVGGLEEPDAGEIYLGGRLIVSVVRGLNLPSDRRNMGMVFQSYAIWPHMSVFDNVAFPLQVRKVPRDQVRDRVREALRTVELDGFEDRPATRLSGGQQQRVALARALVYHPDLLLLDEPLSNLDAKLREQMRFELKKIQQRTGLAMLLVTHDHAEALAVSDRIAVMNAGRVEQIGTPTEVYVHPATPFVRDFLGRVVVLEGILQSSNGTACVALNADAGVIALPQSHVSGLESGQAIQVSCRPEDVRVMPMTSDGARLVSAVIDAAAYVGERLEYNVRTPDGTAFVVFGSPHERFEAGTHVRLDVDLSHCTVWPA